MGIFDRAHGDLFTTYRARLHLRDKLMGGTPKDPKIIEGWLRGVAGVQNDEEVRQMMLRTLVELGAGVRPEMSFEEMEAASEGLAAVKQTNGFKKSEQGLYIEGRQIKAMLKESVNVLFAGEVRGRTRKGPKSFFAERVFVDPDQVHLGVVEPSGVEMFVGHIKDRQGTRSTLTYIEYVNRPAITFEVRVLKNEIPLKDWPQIWVHAQENGLGALRSQGFGRFDIEEWEEIERAPDAADRLLAQVGT